MKNLLLFIFCVLLTNIGFSQDHFTESFETVIGTPSWSSYTTATINFASGAWDFAAVFPESSTDSYDGSKACRINDDVSGASITAPSVNGVGSVSFYYHRPFSGTGDLELQKSVGGGAYTTLATVNFDNVASPTFYSYDVDDASNDIRIRILNDNNSAHLTIDLVTIEEYSVPCTGPTTQASVFNSSSITDNSMGISFTRGDGDGGVLVVAKAGSAVDTDPTSATSYTADASFGNGQEIGTGNFVVYDGIANGASVASGNISISNLMPSTTYHFAVYEYNATGTCYDLTELVGDVVTTCSTPADVTNEAGSFGDTQVSISWTDAICFDEVLVIASTASIVGIPMSADGSHYTADANYTSGSATQDFTAPEYAVYKGLGNSITVTGLTNDTQYFFKVFTRKGTSWSSGVEVDATPVGLPNVVINEIDCDQVGSDADEFVELYGTPNLSLDGLVIVFYNGSDNKGSGGSFDLDGYSLDANGFFVLGSATVVGADATFSGASANIQNGADAIALFIGDAADFPNDVALTQTGLIDAIAYDTNDGDDALLLAGLGLTVQYNEHENGNGDSESIQRFPDGSSNIIVTIATPAMVNLPVELTSFTATPNQKTVDLTWSTATEENNAYFEVQSSVDGRNFETIGQVEGAGTTYEVQAYTFTDENPSNGVNYYRLRQVDFDGGFEYHKVISIVMNGDKSEVQFYPNPTRGELNVVLSTTSESEIQVIDLTGKIVRSINSASEGITTLDISDLANGQYILRIKNEQTISTSLFIKTK
jgi:hypothetical protein